jgi:serine/threonine protein kinase
LASRSDPYALIGTSFKDRYVALEFTGVGRYAAVYRARDTKTEKPVALRLLKVKDTLTPSRRTIVVEHLRALMRPISEVSRRFALFADVLEVSTMGTAAGRWMPVLVQTWMEGESLEAALVRERRAEMPPRSVARAIDLLTPVADALGYAHARGFTHGCLATRNVFVQGAPKEGFRTAGIGDLGMAQALAQVQERSRAFAEVPDGPTYFFAATHGSPENFAGDRARPGPTSDVFSLALLVVELVAGVPPLGEGDDAQLATAAMDAATRPTARAHDRLGTPALTVLERALAVDPASRYATASAFWEALRAAARLGQPRRISSDRRLAAVPSQRFPRIDTIPQWPAVRPSELPPSMLAPPSSIPPPALLAAPPEPPPRPPSTPPPAFVQLAQVVPAFPAVPVSLDAPPCESPSDVYERVTSPSPEPYLRESRAPSRWQSEMPPSMQVDRAPRSVPMERAAAIEPPVPTQRVPQVIPPEAAPPSMPLERAPQSMPMELAPSSWRDRRRSSTPPPGFFEKSPPSSEETNPLFGGQPRARLQTG